MDLITPGLGLIFWQTLTFLVVLFILGKFAWKPILSSLKEREDSIEDALLSAEKARNEMAELKAENEKILDEARLERDSILKEALAAANKIKDEAKDDASKISGKMVEDAKLAIQTEKNAALADVKNQVANLSVQIAEKLLRKELDKDGAQNSLVEEFVKDINLN